MVGVWCAWCGAQYYEVIAVGSSFTLSEWTLFIQVLNGYATMVNGFLLTFWDRYQCCHTQVRTRTRTRMRAPALCTPLRSQH